MVRGGRRFITGACAALMLAGCAGLAPTPVTSLALVGGEVVAAAPPGYCVDAGASRAAAGFAVIAACGAVSGEATRPAINGFVTVQVGEPGSAIVAGAEGALRDFLRTTTGQATLSAAGDAGTVTLRDAVRDDGAVLVSFEDTAPPPFSGLETHEWRAFFDLGGRMLTVAVRGLAAEPMPDLAGRGLLGQAVAALRTANATPDVAAVSAESGDRG